jgi:hypothetical protein
VAGAGASRVLFTVSGKAKFSTKGLKMQDLVHAI